MVAVDGTKVHANASQHANRDYEQIAREILEEAKAVDAAEDERFGERAATSCQRSSRPRRAGAAWLREAKRRLDAERAAEARPIPRSRPERLKEAKRRLEEELWTELRANADYEAYRARGVDKTAARFGTPPTPFAPPADAGREDQRHRPRLQEPEDAARLRPGLQRAGGRATRTRS